VPPEISTKSTEAFFNSLVHLDGTAENHALNMFKTSKLLGYPQSFPLDQSNCWDLLGLWNLLSPFCCNVLEHGISHDLTREPRTPKRNNSLSERYSKAIERAQNARLYSWV
jgi:hypothetical protein